MGEVLPKLTSSPVIRRWNGGAPVLSRADVPYAADCIFNAGVAKLPEDFRGKTRARYVMVFRNDYDYDGKSSFRGCSLGVAWSDDGKVWRAEDKPFLTPADMNDPEVTRVCDPRLTVMDGRCCLCFAVDTRHGMRGGIAVTDDFSIIEVMSLSVPENRNMVLFSEKAGGRYVRLERPFPVCSHGGGDRFDTWISYSHDLKYWGDSQLLLTVEDVPYANDKIGPGAPPIRVPQGWLTLFHAVDRDSSRGKNGLEQTWQKRCCAGVMLLDAENPARILGMSKVPLIAPETRWEVEDGFRTNVIFPGGMILEPDGEVKIYYGASDTVECLAQTTVQELVGLCTEPVGRQIT